MSNWYPSLFEHLGKINNFDKDYMLNILTYSRLLSSKGLPVLFSIAHLCREADSDYSKLRSVVERKYIPYKRFTVKKRSGGYRQIVVPEPFLMRAQRWINKNILSVPRNHPQSKAYQKGQSIYNNAEIHCGAKWLIKIDIERFFESISEKQIYHVFLKMGYTNLLSFELARLCTIVTSNKNKNKSKRWTPEIKNYKYYYYGGGLGHLPQGAPTSPRLSNLVFFKLDNNINEIAKNYNCSYSRYSDDLTFSTYSFSRDTAKNMISEISTILSESGFRRNTKKTKIIPPGARKIVTGLVVNDTRPKIPKDLKMNIENHLYYPIRYGLKSHCQKRGFQSILGFRNHLRGLIDYVAAIDNALAKKYLKKFNKIEWPEII